jgi:hypothetical protein
MGVLQKDELFDKLNQKKEFEFSNHILLLQLSFPHNYSQIKSFFKL